MPQVAALMPSPGPTAASMREVQRLQITAATTQRVWDFEYSWPLGSAVDYVFNLTLTTKGPDNSSWYLLQDPRVGKLPRSVGFMLRGMQNIDW
jgi:hypothetical protein